MEATFHAPTQALRHVNECNYCDECIVGDDANLEDVGNTTAQHPALLLSWHRAAARRERRASVPMNCTSSVGVADTLLVQNATNATAVGNGTALLLDEPTSHPGTTGSTFTGRLAFIDIMSLHRYAAKKYALYQCTHTTCQMRCADHCGPPFFSISWRLSMLTDPRPLPARSFSKTPLNLDFVLVNVQV